MRRIDNPKGKCGIDGDKFSAEEGACALEAIAYMFNLDYEGIRTIFNLIGLKKDDAPTWYQCDKAIKILSAVHKKEAKYHRSYGLKFSAFARVNKKGRFVINQDGHLSCYINGLSVDCWNPDRFKMHGWWEISKKGEVSDSFNLSFHS